MRYFGFQSFVQAGQWQFTTQVLRKFQATLVSYVRGGDAGLLISGLVASNQFYKLFSINKERLLHEKTQTVLFRSCTGCWLRPPCLYSVLSSLRVSRQTHTSPCAKLALTSMGNSSQVGQNSWSTSCWRKPVLQTRICLLDLKPVGKRYEITTWVASVYIPNPHVILSGGIFSSTKYFVSFLSKTDKNSTCNTTFLYQKDGLFPIPRCIELVVCHFPSWSTPFSFEMCCDCSKFLLHSACCAPPIRRAVLPENARSRVHSINTSVWSCFECPCWNFAQSEVFLWGYERLGLFAGSLPTSAGWPL